jgi:hypothetical protein
MVEFAGISIIILAWVVMFAGLLARAKRTGKIQSLEN